MLVCALRLVKAHDLFQYKDMDDVTGNFFWLCPKWLEVFQVKASENSCRRCLQVRETERQKSSNA